MTVQQNKPILIGQDNTLPKNVEPKRPIAIGQDNTLETFEQHASGHVVLKVVPGTPHCGVDDNTLKLRYQIDLKFDKDALDEHGFLLDNTAFRGYFTALSTVPIDYSCERLADKVAEDILAMMGERAEHVHSIRVTLSPFNGVSVTAKIVQRHFHAEPTHPNDFSFTQWSDYPGNPTGVDAPQVDVHPGNPTQTELGLDIPPFDDEADPEPLFPVRQCEDPRERDARREYSRRQSEAAHGSGMMGQDLIDFSRKYGRPY